VVGSGAWAGALICDRKLRASAGREGEAGKRGRPDGAASPAAGGGCQAVKGQSVGLGRPRVWAAPGICCMCSAPQSGFGEAGGV
jgi:hypothetical protein